MKLNSYTITQGRERAAARSQLKAIGFTDEDLKKPIIGVANTWTETMNCNYKLRRSRGACEGRHSGGRRDSDGIQHRLHLRRHHDEYRGHEDVAHQPRGDCRFDRTHGARPHVRRHRGAGRLRQDNSRERRYGATHASIFPASFSMAARSLPGTAQESTTSPFRTSSKPSAPMPRAK